MKSLVLMSALSLALVACADSRGAPNVPVSADVSKSAGNPPPPAILGFTSISPSIEEDISASARSGAGVNAPSLSRVGVSADIGGSTITHTISMGPAEYNANTTKTQVWLNFPRQAPLPPGVTNVTGICVNQRARVVSFAGANTVGEGCWYEIDNVNGGIWVVDMAQYTQHADPFHNPCLNHFCLLLTPNVAVKFYKIIGTTDQGVPILAPAITSPPAPMTFSPPGGRQ